ncbi:hypothetical protein GCM10009119_35460 [Algoriphagus jejuensis]|uniref:Lactobin A/cerein 7B family class IIb bacteriocin n=1 Tax=Algoriphagus jejuensis TaxID=419934 RepID=A0ABP3YIM7_9BACT
MEKLREMSLEECQGVDGGFAHLGVLVTLGVTAGAAGYAAAAWAFNKGEELGRALAKN